MMSLGMLSGPGAFPLVSLLIQLSYTSLVNWVDIWMLWGPLFSRIIPFSVCQGYLRMAHMHVVGWSVMSSQSGTCR